MAITSKPSQQFTSIKEVRDNVLILQDGGLRALMITSSINFALQSEDNQAAILAQFQNFLNSLDFSVEIFMQSRKMDIKPYLAQLEERYHAQPSELMKIQTREYIEFVRAFTENTNIMTKSFFVVVPLGGNQLSLKKGAFQAVNDLIGSKKNKSTAEQSDDFHEQKMQLQQRMAVVEQGLLRCGLRVAHLGSEEIIELFYKLFNPGESDKPMMAQQS